MMLAELSGQSPAAAPTDDLWKILITDGNKAYEAGDMAGAQFLYQRALNEAEQIFDAKCGQPNGIPAPVIYNITCHNLAALFEATGQASEAERLYQRAYDRLAAAAASPALPLETRLSCTQHLKHALVALVKYLKARDFPEEQLGTLVDEARHTASGVYRTLHHMTQADAAFSQYPALAS